MTLFRRRLANHAAPPQPRQLSRITQPIFRHPVTLSRSLHNQSPNCGTHIFPAPTWTSPTSCTFLRSWSSTKLELYQAAASQLAIGIEDRQANTSQSHGELCRRRLHCPWWCREIVPLQRLVSTPVQKVSSQQRRQRQSHVQTASPRNARPNLSLEHSFRGPNHDRGQDGGWLVNLARMRWQFCAPRDLRKTPCTIVAASRKTRTIIVHGCAASPQ